ncbi:methyltransferase domain-containing protein [Marinobacter salinexigens]|uniref:Methyltransferase domain-containing protein n=1 Tax=Marinobacter salinexigens TaxID=2919747 RepID=A0A5B0VI27_9GAMM|nr:methyltransferase domain-containing protein [Marinobacter salinexigens]KAA1174246.1 methyltransferase domain-containing protein [Marinobacter salinexigens]
MFNQGEIVHHTRDEFGSILVVDYRKHRVMTFNSIFEQSKIDRRYPYLPVHEYNRAMILPAAFFTPQHVTVLGLGGGVMVSGFHHLLPDCHIHAVELRQAVVDVAREFFDLPLSDRIKITVADAGDTLARRSTESTDLLLSDLYSHERMSPTQAQKQFVDQCSRVLTPSGWLVLNYHRTPDPDGPYFQQLRKHFSVLLMLRTKSNNTVIYASKQGFDALSSKDPRLKSLEDRFPIGWRQLMAKVTRV